MPCRLALLVLPLIICSLLLGSAAAKSLVTKTESFGFCAQIFERQDLSKKISGNGLLFLCNDNFTPNKNRLIGSVTYMCGSLTLGVGLPLILSTECVHTFNINNCIITRTGTFWFNAADLTTLPQIPVESAYYSVNKAVVLLGIEQPKCAIKPSMILSTTISKRIPGTVDNQAAFSDTQLTEQFTFTFTKPTPIYLPA